MNQIAINSDENPIAKIHKAKLSSVVSNPFRQELTLARYALYIFLPKKSALYGKPATYDVDIPSSIISDEKKTGSISVIPFMDEEGNAHTLTADELRGITALCSMWLEQGKDESGFVRGSIASYLAATGRKQRGNSIEIVRKEFKRMENVGIYFTRSFMTKEVKGGERVVQKETNCRLIEGTEITQEIWQGKRTRTEFSTYIHPNIIANYLLGETKPYNLEIFRDATVSDSALLLYTKIEQALGNPKATVWRQASRSLFNDLRLTAKSFNRPSRRKKRLEELMAEFKKYDVSTGTIEMSIDRTINDDDYMLVVRKTPHPQIERTLPKNGCSYEEINFLIDDLCEDLHTTKEKHGDLLFKICSLYSHSLIRRAVSELKADVDEIQTTRVQVFNTIMHRLAHEQGEAWIKGCTPDSCDWFTKVMS